MQPIEVLERTIADPVGIKVMCDNATNTRNRIYRERNKQAGRGVTAYDRIAIFQLSDNELWLINHSALERYRDENFTENLDETINEALR